MDMSLILAAVIVAAAGLGAAWMLAATWRRRDASSTTAAAIEALARGQNELAGRLSQLTADGIAREAKLAETVTQRLDQVAKQMGESLTTSATRTAETLGDLRKHLSVIDHAQKNIAELSTQVLGLQDILANKQARGAFGNIQLRDLVQSILPPSAYAFEVQLKNGRRVDCLIQLPNPPGPIAVDAKFPLESYQSLRNAGDDRARTEAAALFRRDVLKHVKDIAERYILPGETAESALMFLPSEAIYAELHANFTGVIEESYRAKVWIVSPTTLMATLNTVRAVLKDVNMRVQAAAIQGEVQKMLVDVRRLTERVDRLRHHFGQTAADLADIVTSAKKIDARGKKIVDIELGETAAPETLEATATAELEIPFGDAR
ncbi:MAG: DNA recombination protein RmuC [Alphaproteobacteria bacterium]|nr:DNA recombination protein RmuC [Alphaproteobacteria bacterium]